MLMINYFFVQHDLVPPTRLWIPILSFHEDRYHQLFQQVAQKRHLLTLMEAKEAVEATTQETLTLESTVCFPFWTNSQFCVFLSVITGPPNLIIVLILTQTIIFPNPNLNCVCAWT